MQLSTVGDYRTKSTCYIISSVEVALTMMLPQWLHFTKTQVQVITLTPPSAPAMQGVPIMKPIDQKQAKTH